MAIPIFGLGVLAGAFIFGGDESKQYAEFNQSINNNVYQQLTGTCKATCGPAIEGINVALINSTLVGGIDFTQTCPARAECTINQTAESTVENVLNAVSQQSAIIQNSLISIGGSKTNKEVYIDQRIKNQISQIISSSCSATSSSLIRSVNLYINGSKLKEISFAQTGGNAIADCAMNNISRINLYNEATAKNKQSDTILSFIGGLALVIGVVVVVGIIAFALINIIRPSSKTPAE